ncbi:MAG: carboxypeptidase-like regulatory domain-containing protein [Dysgonomonas sp.]|nr:carboxypeptidase-like regulatory domain-containing protein [Dysgonomonas sp.]
MKAKLGIILLLFCVASFFIYRVNDPRKAAINTERLIRGKVINAANSTPIEGATVAIQGSNPKAVSDANGEYAIMAFTNQELVFRHDNYKTAVIKAEDAKEVKMEIVDSNYIEEVNKKLNE